MMRTDRSVRRLVVVAFVFAAAMPQARSSQQVEVATTVAFTEGPTVDRDGTVYFTDIINQRIMRLGADGVLSTYRENSNVANGLLIVPGTPHHQQRVKASTVRPMAESGNLATAAYAPAGWTDTTI